MIRSMTGFGKAVVKSQRGTVTVETKALNHKFFEVSAKIPNGLMQFEDGLKNIIHQKIKRGKIYLNIEIDGQKEGAARIIIDSRMADIR